MECKGSVSTSKSILVNFQILYPVSQLRHILLREGNALCQKVSSRFSSVAIVDAQISGIAWYQVERFILGLRCLCPWPIKVGREHCWFFQDADS